VDYLEWLRWPDGFVWPGRGQLGGWRLGDGAVPLRGMLVVYVEDGRHDLRPDAHAR
jgi:hypothetical protein